MEELTPIYDSAQVAMGKSIDALKKDLLALRSNKVNINILDGVRVEYYDAPTPLNQVGSVMSKDANTIVITPWDKALLKDIEKAINEANLNVNPNSDGECIKLFFPPMTTDQRKLIAKDAKALGEKCKGGVRSARQSANKALDRLKKDKVITEDEFKKAQDMVQKLTDEHTKKCDDIVHAKEAEILKV